MFKKYRQPPICPGDVKTILDELLLNTQYYSINETRARVDWYAARDNKEYIIEDFFLREKINYTKDKTFVGSVEYSFPYSKNTLIDKIEDAFAKRYPEYHKKAILIK